jgi:hypothetical protein
MTTSTSTQILSFENFGALEGHLRMLKSNYNDMVKKYEETLGYILRDTKPASAKTQKVQEKWALEMQRAMVSSAKTTSTTKVPTKKDAKEKSHSSASKLFGKGKDKEKQESVIDWISLDPMSIFVGPKNRGMAEIYFDTINVLRENINKISLALSICSTLKVKASTAGSASLIVSFVNDIPTKVLLQSSDDAGAKKYAMTFRFSVPSMKAIV